MNSKLSNTALRSRAFSSGGMYILREKKSYVLFVAHRVGMFGAGAHKHNDTLSFEWCFGEQPIIVDPGTGCYTGNLNTKKLYRSTRSHNTVVVDGEEQIPIDGVMFALNNIVGDVNVIDWQDDTSETKVSAQHSFYARLPGSVVHRRTMVLNKLTHQVTLEDKFYGSGSHRLEWYFHLAPDLSASHEDNQFIISAYDKDIAIIRYPAPLMNAEILPGAVSQRYNIETESQILYCNYIGRNLYEAPFAFKMSPL